MTAQFFVVVVLGSHRVRRGVDALQRTARGLVSVGILAFGAPAVGQAPPTADEVRRSSAGAPAQQSTPDAVATEASSAAAKLKQAATTDLAVAKSTITRRNIIIEVNTLSVTGGDTDAPAAALQKLLPHHALATYPNEGWKYWVTGGEADDGLFDAVTDNLAPQAKLSIKQALGITLPRKCQCGYINATLIQGGAGFTPTWIIWDVKRTASRRREVTTFRLSGGWDAFVDYIDRFQDAILAQ